MSLLFLAKGRIVTTKYHGNQFTVHDHINSRKKFGNTHYLTLDALVDGFRQAGYLELYVNSGSISYNFINF